MRLRAIRRTLPRPSPATFGYRNTGPVLPSDATRGFLPPLRTANRSLQTRARRARDGSPEKASCLSPYVSSYPPPYRSAYTDLCRALRRHVCLHSYGDLYLDLNLDLSLNLNLFLFLNSFQPLFRTFFASLFGSSFASKFHESWASSCLAWLRHRLRGRHRRGSGGKRE